MTGFSGHFATTATSSLYKFNQRFLQEETVARHAREKYIGKLRRGCRVRTDKVRKYRVFSCDKQMIDSCRRWEVLMREKTTERKLVQAVKAIGGIAPKFVSPGFDGMPDRLVLLPMGRTAFVEVKAMGCKPRPLQEARHGMLRRLGFQVFVLDNEAQIKEILKRMGGDAE